MEEIKVENSQGSTLGGQPNKSSVFTTQMEFSILNIPEDVKWFAVSKEDLGGLMQSKSSNHFSVFVGFSCTALGLLVSFVEAINRQLTGSEFRNIDLFSVVVFSICFGCAFTSGMVWWRTKDNAKELYSRITSVGARTDRGVL